MRWASYRSGDGTTRVGLVQDTRVHGLRGDRTLVDLLADDALDAAASEARDDPREIVPLAEAHLLAPIPRPPSVRDFMSFEEHVVTSTAAVGLVMSPVWYEQPTFYFTNPAAVLGPEDEVPIAPGSKRWDFELEIAAVIGAGGRDIPVDEAASHIAGYTIMCDWSARDLQEQESRVGLGPAKGKDSATTLGPYLVTPDELESHRTARGYDLSMTADVNGRPYSAGNWSTLYWTFPQMIAYASRGTTLHPGDVIGSGTVGTGCILELSRVHGLDAFPWLEPGDRVTLAVEGLGSLRSTVVPGVVPLPL